MPMMYDVSGQTAQLKGFEAEFWKLPFFKNLTLGWSPSSSGQLTRVRHLLRAHTVLI